MKKQKLQLWILLALLIILGAGYLGLQKYNESQSQKEEELQGQIIVSLEESDIVRLTYDYEGTTYLYEKTDDIWYYTEDTTLKLIQSSLNDVAANVAEITALHTITGVTDMEQYGLAEPDRTFSFATAGESYEFYVGDYNEMADLYYICRPGEDTVYTVETAVITAFDLDVMDLVVEE